MRKYLLYAIGEIALVMIGILLALQINNWNENRKTKAQEGLFLTSILEDLNKNKRVAEESMKTNVYNKEIGETWIMMMNPDTVNVQRTPELDSLLFWGPTYHIADFILSTANSPISNESLALISNEQLKRLLVDYPSYINLYKDRENEVRRIVIEKIRPQGEKHISLRHMYAGTSPFPTDYTDLLRDRQLNNDYINRNWQIDEMLLSLHQIENVTDELISITAEELASRFSE